MHVLLVNLNVKPEFVADFIRVTTDNASNSVQEPGVVRFDFIQNADEPTRFMLIEIYHDPSGHAAHRETAHYLRWRDAVADMFAEPRSATKFRNVFPTDAEWK